MTWQENAACRGLNPELFYPPRGYGEPEVINARNLCLICTVRRPCLDYALAHHEVFGVWGGFTYRERRAIQKARTLASGGRRYPRAGEAMRKVPDTTEIPIVEREQRQAHG